MGARGPIGKKRRARSVTTAGGVKLRQLPPGADAIFARLAKDVEGLEAADVALVQATAVWVEVLLAARDDLENEDGSLALTVTDTAHGNKEEARKNPLLIVMRTASEQIRANAQQLGMSPAARARLPEKEAEQMSLADILFGDAKMQKEQNEGAAQGGRDG